MTLPNAPMCRGESILFLLLAAALETGGDAILRVGLHSNSLIRRSCLFGAATVLLFAYGWTVNPPPWDFGKLLGTYIVFVFLLAQVISWLVFKQTPSLTVLLGGS